MLPPNSEDEVVRPVLVVVAGFPGSGKTTLLEQMVGEDGFPVQLVVDAMEDPSSLDQAMTRAVALQRSVAIETSFESAAVALWMMRAADRGFRVELIILGVEDDEVLLDRHGRRVERRKLLETVRRMSAAVDRADRVLAIDNTTGTPFIAATIDHGDVKVLDSRPKWVAQRILAPRLARIASFKAIRSMYQAVASNANVMPVLQVGGLTAVVSTGKVVAVSDYHVLQQLGDAMHVIHDVGLLATGGAGLALNAMATIAYAVPDAEPSDRAMDVERDRSQER